MESPVRLVLIKNTLAVVCALVALIAIGCGGSGGDQKTSSHALSTTDSRAILAISSQPPSGPITYSCGMPPCPYVDVTLSEPCCSNNPPNSCSLTKPLLSTWTEWCSSQEQQYQNWCSAWAQQNYCTVTQSQVDDVTTQYVIDRPIVTKPNWDYPMVKFMPGDVVTVSASGCVQTAGTSFLGGGTWKNYVYPYPEYFKGDWKYEGTVTIPEAVNLGTPIYSLFGTTADGTWGWRPQTVKDLSSTDPQCVAPSRGLHLQLGYTDDNYGDNGYWGHDDGDGDQCAGNTTYPFSNHGQPAQVTVVVQRGVPGVFYSALPYDLVPNCVDENYIFMNAQWGWQDTSLVNYSKDNPDTSQVTMRDTPDTFKELIATGAIGWLFSPFLQPLILAFEELGFGQLLCNVDDGHRNWFDVTYTGRVTWDAKSANIPELGDDDYNLVLWTSEVYKEVFETEGHGLLLPTGYGQGGMPDAPTDIHMEFYAGETIDEFTYHGTWWDGLRSAVDTADDQWTQVHSKIDGLYAITTGLMGIDEVHDANGGNEIHPVHVLAIQYGREQVDGTRFRDKWALFVRNYGNEGECASLDHYLLLNQVTIRIGPSIDPKRVDSTGVPYVSYTVPEQSFLSHSNMLAGNWNGQPFTYYAPLDDANHPDLLFTFNLENPEIHSWYAGDFEIEWTLAKSIPSAAFRPLIQKPPLFTDPPSLVASTQKLSSVQQPLQVATAASTYHPEPEEVAEAIWAAMTPEQQADHLNLYNSVVTPRPLPEVTTVPAVQVYTPPSRPARVPQAGVGPLPVWQMAQRVGQARALCAVNNGDIPSANAATFCAHVPPITLLTTSGGASGKNGWIVTPLTVTLTVRDASGVVS